MNIAACIAVIALHVNGAIWTFSYDRYWVTSLVIETVFYWAVPVFLMLSGATLMDYRERYDTKTFLKKRFIKTGIPFLFWSLVSIPWAVYVTHYLDISAVQSFKGIFNTILNCNAMSIYWFFPVLFALYLCIPALSLIPKDNRKKAFEYMIIYSFITYSVFPVVGTFTGYYINGALRNPLNGGGYVMFLLLGYYIANYDISPRNRKIIYLCGIAALLIRYGYSLYGSYKIGNIDRTLFNYVYFPSVMLAVAVFVWFKYMDWSFLTKPQIISVIKKLSSASFGIYLTHFYIMRFIVDYFYIPMQSWEWRIFGIPLVYFISLLCVKILKEIPFFRRMVP